MGDAHKSEAMMETAVENGWKAQVKPEIQGTDITWNLYCVRGQETMHVVWTNELQTSATYVYGQYRLVPARRAGVVRLLTGSPDPRKLNRSAANTLIADREMAWTAETPAIEIMQAVMNRRVSWIRKLDGQVMDALVDVNLQNSKSAKAFRVYDAPSGKRILEWADSIGFHAVAIDQIINVA